MYILNLKRKTYYAMSFLNYTPIKGESALDSCIISIQLVATRQIVSFDLNWEFTHLLVGSVNGDSTIANSINGANY